MGTEKYQAINWKPNGFKFQCDHYAHHQQRKETDHIFYLDLQARDDPIGRLPHQQHDKE
ncbi:MAG: hypothetical protein ACLUVG_09795 [Phocaeicola vulgatus]